jgi:hypothetical protein
VLLLLLLGRPVKPVNRGTLLVVVLVVVVVVGTAGAVAGVGKAKPANAGAEVPPAGSGPLKSLPADVETDDADVEPKALPPSNVAPLPLPIPLPLPLLLPLPLTTLDPCFSSI